MVPFHVTSSSDSKARSCYNFSPSFPFSPPSRITERLCVPSFVLAPGRDPLLSRCALTPPVGTHCSRCQGYSGEQEGPCQEPATRRAETCPGKGPRENGPVCPGSEINPGREKQ